ncbi:MAG TPA: endonuclease/exonuclease/phosphatase family protein [Candidatus Saccharimonadales bacterium]|nr:endonuclease/exonuclease/phosphatase family protein [Candidatus Saccharimonadales bacterium]
MASRHTITVATANTHFGRALRISAGLTPLHSADILLLQEVFDISEAALEHLLAASHFTLIHAAPKFGLAIAIRTAAGLRLLPGTIQEHRLAKASRPEQFIIQKATRSPLIFTERGVISCQLATPNGKVVTIANVHPTTPIATTPRARHRQIKRLTRVLTQFYHNSPLILGGDMNHYPRPRKIDLALHKTTSLTPVELGTTPTWYARGSKEERLLAFAARAIRRPLEHFNGQHDIILYRETYFIPIHIEVVDIPSDHRAIIATFRLTSYV